MSSITTQLDFAMLIEKMASDNKQTYIEAVLKYCSDNFIEPQEIAKMIDGSLKDKIRSNFVDMDMLKKTATLADI